MAEIEGILTGQVISKVNGIVVDGVATDASPNRVVKLDSTNSKQFILPESEGNVILGVLLPDFRYENGVTPAGKSGNIQISGIVDIVCDGDISANDFVIATTEGKVKSIGSIDSLSSTPSVGYVVGVAVEAGVSGGKVAVLLNKQLVSLS